MGDSQVAVYAYYYATDGNRTPANITIPADANVTIPEGSFLENIGTLTNNGTLNFKQEVELGNGGTIDNNGTLNIENGTGGLDEGLWNVHGNDEDMDGKITGNGTVNGFVTEVTMADTPDGTPSIEYVAHGNTELNFGLTLGDIKINSDGEDDTLMIPVNNCLTIAEAATLTLGANGSLDLSKLTAENLSEYLTGTGTLEVPKGSTLTFPEGTTKETLQTLSVKVYGTISIGDETITIEKPEPEPD